MPPYYDIYGLSSQRDRPTIERFLDHYAIREKIELAVDQEVVVHANEKYQVEETWKSLNTLSELLDFGIENRHSCFVYYIGDNLKRGVNHIILKFTYDGKIIFGISVEEKRISNDGILVDNYSQAFEVEQSIAQLTNAEKTSVQFEYPPADDEEEFYRDMELWSEMNEEKRRFMNS